MKSSEQMTIIYIIQKYFSIFIAEYGTSYVEEVSMGAKMVVETRFNKRANGVDETAQRMSCIAVRHTYIYTLSSVYMVGSPYTRYLETVQILAYTVFFSQYTLLLFSKISSE